MSWKDHIVEFLIGGIGGCLIFGILFLIISEKAEEIPIELINTNNEAVLALISNFSCYIAIILFAIAFFLALIVVIICLYKYVLERR